MVEDGLITWQEAIYQLHRELDKMDIEAACARDAMGLQECKLSEDALETIQIELKK
jgi:hypothetical protein